MRSITVCKKFHPLTFVAIHNFFLQFKMFFIIIKQMNLKGKIKPQSFLKNPIYHNEKKNSTNIALASFIMIDLTVSIKIMHIG